MDSVAARSNISKTVLYELGKPGKKAFLDNEEAVRALMTLAKLPEDECDAQVARYRRLRAADTTTDGTPAPTRLSWRRLALILGAAAILVAAGYVSALLFQPDESPSAGVPYAAVSVQNMVALGESDLRPDSTPAYLSTERVSRCATPTKNCKVAGTEMDTGVLLVATCQAEGEELVNFNLDSTSPENPNRARSKRWYDVRLPDGRTGFINEVYLAPHDRGGLGLPSCPRA
ncbi:hypothetical protein [Amycolatopsis sp. NBC_00438]|uniref:hypothetical protein n=1 Tax=Amycolatopsis sp. NBC_00438 TaxID=2903558 RepID=UPI002E1C8705